MSRLWLVLVLVLAACVPPDGSQPQYATGNPQQQQQPQATGLNCTQLFSCFAGCNADGACVQGCQAQADPSAQAAALCVNVRETAAPVGISVEGETGIPTWRPERRENRPRTFTQSSPPTRRLLTRG